MSALIAGGAKKAKKAMSCGVNPSTGRCKKGEPKNKDMCELNKKTNRCIKDKYTEAKMHAKIFKGGAKKAKKDMSCGVNPSTGRCKKGEPKDKDMCELNKKTNRCIKDKYTEAKMHAKIFKGGAKKAKKDMSCGVNPSTGRCKKGEPKDKDMCELNKKTNRCRLDQFTEAKMYAKLKM